jgi:hypothetical protein
VDEGGERRLVVIMCKKVEGCAEEIVVNMFSTKEGDGVSGRENCPTLVGSIIGENSVVRPSLSAPHILSTSYH